MGNFIGYYSFNKSNKKLLLSYKNDDSHTTVKHFDNTYKMLYNGTLYNGDELKNSLIENGFELTNNSYDELILKGFICFGYDVLKKLNGVFSFAIWDENKEEMFLARDHFGIKPLYYTLVNNSLIFASEIKDILQFPEVKCEIDWLSISELFGLGPAHTPGISVFKDIFEIKPAHFAVLNKSRFSFR